MINIKKGTGLSLQQSDAVLTLTANEDIKAGMVVATTSAGAAIKSIQTTGDKLVGFALGNQEDTDVIDAGKIAVIRLDGHSVIETDQAFETINSTNFPLGGPVYAYTAGSTALSLGKVGGANQGSGNTLVGYVEGIRTVPAAKPTTLTPAVSHKYVDRSGTEITPAAVNMGWPTVTVVGIKLIAR